MQPPARCSNYRCVYIDQLGEVARNCSLSQLKVGTSNNMEVGSLLRSLQDSPLLLGRGREPPMDPETLGSCADPEGDWGPDTHHSLGKSKSYIFP